MIISRAIIFSTTLFFSILSYSGAHDSEKIEYVTIKKDFTLKLDKVNFLSRYCYFNTIYNYVYKKPGSGIYEERSAYRKEEFVEKSVHMMAGSKFEVYYGPNQSPVHRFPYRSWANGSEGPEIYHNHITLLIPYENSISSSTQVGSEAYLSVSLVCTSNRFSNPSFGDRLRARVENRDSYVKDLNETLSNFLDFDGGLLLIREEPTNPYNYN